MNCDLHHTMTAQYAAPKVSGNGVVRWDGGVKCVLPSVKLCGAAAQDGTPTPDAPVMPVCNDGVFQAHGDTMQIPAERRSHSEMSGVPIPT